MKKIAFFVEGKTERLFLEKLLQEIFTAKHLAIEISRIKGGSKMPITFTTIKVATVTSETKYYILIYSCGGDSNVRSYIQDQRASLISSGYEKIIGLRDVHPISRNDIHKLITLLYFKLPQKPIPIVFVLNVMEIEATFLAEYTHFPRINHLLNSTMIGSSLGFNPEHDNMELRDFPAQDLEQSYNLVGENYDKSDVSLERTTSAIDYSEIYFNTRKNVTSLNLL